MAMGRGSDTRMYAPRSESDHMHTSANDDETKYNPTSPEDNEKRREEKKLKEEEKKESHSKLKHIKISSNRKLSGSESPVAEDDSNKQDDERELSLQGGPAGSRGHMLDLATGAKSGTGSAMSPGLPITMSIPMKDAWSSLLKNDEHPNLDNFKNEGYDKTQLHELSHGDLERVLEGHPNAHIREKVKQELMMRVYEAEGSNLDHVGDSKNAFDTVNFYENQFQDLPSRYGEGMDEGDLSDTDEVPRGEGFEGRLHERLGDIDEAMPGQDFTDTELPRNRFDHLLEHAPPELSEKYLQRIREFHEQGAETPEYSTEAMMHAFGEGPPPTSNRLPADFPKGEDVIDMPISNVHPRFNTATGFNHDWQDKLAREPMKDAWSY